VIVLALWAIAAATDYSTGLIRVVVQAYPKRVRLLAGKIAALASFTVMAATIAYLVMIFCARRWHGSKASTASTGRRTSPRTSSRASSTSRSLCWSGA
jgi:hypothetical protein